MSICFPGCDIINFEVNLIFLIKPIFNKTKKSRQKCKYLENKKSFYGEIKNIFHHFQKDSIVAKNSLRLPEGASLTPEMEIPLH